MVGGIQGIFALQPSGEKQKQAPLRHTDASTQCHWTATHGTCHFRCYTGCAGKVSQDARAACALVAGDRSRWHSNSASGGKADSGTRRLFCQENS